MTPLPPLKSACDAPPNSTKWLTARREGIGGSDIAALMGANPWATPLDVWQSKTDPHHPTTAGEAARWGHILEPVVRDEYARRHDSTAAVVITAPTIPSIVKHPDVDRARASLDAVVTYPNDAPAVLEIKTAGIRQASKWADRGLPDAYAWQVQWQLAVTAMSTAHIAVLIGGQDYQERRIEADTSLGNKMLDFVADWWTKFVDTNTPPQPDPIRDIAALAGLWTPDPDLTVTVADDLLTDVIDTKAALKAAKTAHDHAVATVQMAMRQATTAVDSYGERSATWAATKPRTQINTTLLAEQYPDVALMCTTQSKPSRRFVVTTQAGPA
jgi:putative phage-type endonuclease